MPMILLCVLLLSSNGVQADAMSEARAGQAAAAQQDWSAAIEHFTRAIRSNEFDNPNQAVAYYNRGLNYHRLGQYNRAIEDYSAALALNPAQLNALYNRAVAYTAKAEYADALAQLNAFLALQPDHIDALVQRAGLYVEQQQPQPALQDLNRALQLAPNNPQVVLARADANRQLGRYDAALADYNRLLQALPEEGQATAMVYAGRGEVYEDMEQPEQAIEDYLKAYSLDPENPAIQAKAARTEKLYVPFSAGQRPR